MQTQFLSQKCLNKVLPLSNITKQKHKYYLQTYFLNEFPLCSLLVIRINGLKNILLFQPSLLSYFKVINYIAKHPLQTCNRKELSVQLCDTHLVDGHTPAQIKMFC